VEDTWFSSANAALAGFPYEAHLASYLQKRFGQSAYTIRYREHGQLPMNASHRPSFGAARCHSIGASGGMARSSSGYAFAEIQSACDAVESAIVDHAKTQAQFAAYAGAGIAIAPWRSRMSYWMDAVFLRVIEEHPALLPDLFVQIFRATPPESLVRFLSGVACTKDSVRVMAACPKVLFLKAAVGLT
jgi:lycopene beta-cyclase